MKGFGWFFGAGDLLFQSQLRSSDVFEGKLDANSWREFNRTLGTKNRQRATRLDARSDEGCHHSWCGAGMLGGSYDSVKHFDNSKRLGSSLIIEVTFIYSAHP